jgi:AcrR family transcriptional regulator
MPTKDSSSAQARRQSIIMAARPLFAEKGFHATSVREIAKKAGVSEALIYRYFPNKEALYNELLDYSRDLFSARFTTLSLLVHDTQTLVLGVFALLELIVLDVPGRIADQKMHERLLFHSLMGDTIFARSHFKILRENWEDTFNACFQAATEAGDIAQSPIPPSNRMWFVHHLAMSLNLCHLSGKPAFEYEGSREQLVEQAALFCLKGIGMTNKAIDKYFDPKELRKVTGMFYKLGPQT